jgi:dihydrodipicolinate synthase/N-acetylneuraminate lyase
MKKSLKDTRWLLCVGTFLAVTFLAASVMAAKVTLEGKIQKAEELSIKASEMATKAKVSYNIGLLKESLELANQATYLVLEVVTEAQKKDDPALSQMAIDTANSVSEAIAQIIAAATFISEVSTDKKTIAETKEILKQANKAKELNIKAIQIVRPSVVEPGEKIASEKQAPKVKPPDTETTEQQVYQERDASPSQ